jgi:hypothetical protein
MDSNLIYEDRIQADTQLLVSVMISLSRFFSASFTTLSSLPSPVVVSVSEGFR